MLFAGSVPISTLCASASTAQLAASIGLVANMTQAANNQELVTIYANLPRNLEDWRSHGLEGDELTAVAAMIGQEPEGRLLADRLLALEGRLWGEIVQGRQLDEPLRQVLHQRLNRELTTKRNFVEKASRWIRQPWLKAFMYHARVSSLPSTGNVHWTPLVQSFELERELGRPVFLKLESEQSVGSFKNRGATNLLIHQMIDLMLAGVDPRDVSVVTASHGNAAQGVVQAAHNLGIPNVIVYLPKNASRLKRRQLIDQGAEVRLQGQTFEEAEDRAREESAPSHLSLFVPAFRHDLIAEGQGSIGLEIEADMKAFGHNEFAVIAGAGGLGLLSGLSVALSANHSIFGVESELLAFASRSFAVGEVVQPADINHIDTVADGSALLRIDGQLFDRYVKPGVQDIVAIPEPEIQGAIAALHDFNVMAEGSAAATVGAMLFGGLKLERYGVPSDLPVVFVVSGKNIDEEVRAPVLAKYRQGDWRRLEREARTEDLNRYLTHHGFVRDNVVLPLIDEVKPYHYIRTLNFVDFLACRLPEGWDLIDAFRELDFGPFVDVKGPRATFRSMGEFSTRRYEEDAHQLGNRLYALFHPVANRANIVIQAGAVAASRPEVLGTLIEELEQQPGTRIKTWISRLAGEARVIEHYARYPEWQLRLAPELSERERHSKMRRLLDVVDRLNRAIAQLLPHFESDTNTQLFLLSALNQPIPVPIKK